MKDSDFPGKVIIESATIYNSLNSNSIINNLLSVDIYEDIYTPYVYCEILIIDYNKLGPPNLSGQYDFYYQGDVLGVDQIGESLDVAEMCGIVEKGGAWYTVNGERFQGRAKAVSYLKENPKVVNKLIEDINAKS